MSHVLLQLCGEYSVDAQYPLSLNALQISSGNVSLHSLDADPNNQIYDYWHHVQILYHVFINNKNMQCERYP